MLQALSDKLGEALGRGDQAQARASLEEFARMPHYKGTLIQTSAQDWLDQMQAGSTR